MGVFCLAIVVGVVIVSDRKDQALAKTYKVCEALYYQYALPRRRRFGHGRLPLEGREGFLISCMR